jgi:hypothetical protein
MTEAEWLTCTFPARQLYHLQLARAQVGRKCRLLACAALRLRWERRTAPSIRAAVETAERFADGTASADELARARAGAEVPASQMSRSFWWGDEGTSQDVWYSVAVHPTGCPLHELVAHYTWVNSTLRSLFAMRSQRLEAALLRDIFGNPFRRVILYPLWLTSDVVALARGIYDDRAFDRMPILADALQDAGCDNDDILSHCRGPGPHVRGCWVVDMLLGKE